MCTTTPSNVVWAYGETVDTPVLGTGLARGESSNLSTPTKNIGYVDGYVSDTLDTQVERRVSVLLDKRQCVSLRNYRPLFFIAQVTNYYCYYLCFLKNINFAPVR